MRVKIPTDPTMPNPQDPKDAPHSHNGGGSGFMPYVPAWERLADAIKHVMAGGRPKEQAQTDLCRAIADGTVKIRGKLKRHTTRASTSKAVLEGTDFQIPPEIKPEDLDWERSRPLKPWIVRRGSFSTTGILGSGVDRGLHGRRYECLCAAEKQDEFTRHASSETPDKHKPTGARKPGDARWPWSKIDRRAAKTRCGWASTPSRGATTEI